MLFHGRGADEYDLLPLLDALDPERRLHGYCPRRPAHATAGGAHWYVVPRVGYPDPLRSPQGFAAAAGFVDSLPHERIVLGGFSQGAVMAFAVGLGRGRPRPAAMIAFSGFIPEVEGWELDTGAAAADRDRHGTYDPVIPVEFASPRARRGSSRRRRRPLPRVADRATRSTRGRRGAPSAWLGEASLRERRLER